MIEDLAVLLESQDFDKDNLKTTLRDYATTKNLKFNNLMKSLRMILSGLQVSVVLGNFKQ